MNAPSFRLSGAGDRRREYQTFQVKTLSPHIGAEVPGIDFSKPLSNAQVEDLHAAFADWSVLVFRDQKLTREDHKRAVRYFGQVHTHPTNHSRDGDPEVLIVKTDEGSTFTVGNEWHADVTCQDVPPLGSMLYITEPPEVGGGDTLFADMYLAYELLSEPMKAFLEGLKAMHDGAGPYVGHYKTAEPEGGYPKNAHPIVAVHPVTGRKVLYVNAAFTTHIVGLRQWESKAILEAIYSLVATTPKLWCRVNWQPNTLTLWDNRCTQHHAVWDYYPYSRYGERIAIVGEGRPVGVAG
jgi:taurine dioxygenase